MAINDLAGKSDQTLFSSILEKGKMRSNSALPTSSVPSADLYPRFMDDALLCTIGQ